MRNKIVTSILLVGLMGCGGGINIKDTNQYVPVATGETELMPSQEQLAAPRTKVVLFETNDKTHHESFSRIAVALNGAVEEHINNTGAEIVDRALAKKLEQEIDLSEQGGGIYDGPAIAHYAIKSAIHFAEVTRRFNKASSWTDKKGKTHYSPANCRHTAKVKGTLTFYEIPNLRLVKAINLEGRSSSSTETGNNACPISTEQAASILAQATTTAVKKKRTALQNEVTPTGYVSERLRTGNEKSGKGIIVTTLGLDLGVKSGEKIEVYHVENRKNHLTEKESYFRTKIAQGKVSSQLGSDYSWIVIDEGFEKILIGHPVKIVHKVGMFEGVRNKLN